MEAQGEEERIHALVWALDQTRLIRIEGIDTEDRPLNKREKDFRILN